ncbi:hypothetical protein HPP92_019069 [Vanilla planifolia]|uniref:Peptidase A1 domain-containing protein n=1 Tax=Vanilla planifolia TaxID=51239 RepID=A0A835PZP4_VANPL|nr:hypothetical protein HPP92_019590 [Vanilla planifolia]KAG0464905.1 hypothetical protein HPP92_019069 [Vanilla planifolia]
MWSSLAGLVFAGVLMAFLVVLPATAGHDGFPLTMKLERGISMKASMEELRARDRVRHRRMLQGVASAPGVVDFPVYGSSNPFTVGLYYTRVKLGNPSKEFYVQIDTGSDILWVSCSPCTGCPSTSGLNYGDGSGTSGSDNGGGILVLGEIVEPGIVYTPLVQSQPHYNLNLESIAVNGQKVAIDSSVFTTSSTQGTIVDSGTTLAYLAEQAYDPFVTAIVSSVSSSLVKSIVTKGNQCFLTVSSVDDVFPQVTLNFNGGASMLLKPEDYLIQQGTIENAIVWCIGWQKNDGQEITILGDLVLKDKIIVYDLGNQRIGWSAYDCSQSVNVSTSSGKNEYLNAGQLDVNGSPSNERLILMTTWNCNHCCAYPNSFVLIVVASSLL